MEKTIEIPISSLESIIQIAEESIRYEKDVEYYEGRRDVAQELLSYYNDEEDKV